MTNMHDNELNLEELTQAGGGIGGRTRTPSDTEIEFIRSCRAEKMRRISKSLCFSTTGRPEALLLKTYTMP